MDDRTVLVKAIGCDAAKGLRPSQEHSSEGVRIFFANQEDPREKDTSNLQKIDGEDKDTRNCEKKEF
jgi:hypothetical protein